MAPAKQVDLVKGDEDVSSEPLYLHLSITDPEVVAALTDAGEGRDRQEFAQTALRIGVLSLKAARGTIDGGTIRNESERLLLTLEERLSSHREVLDEALGVRCGRTSTLQAAHSPSACSAWCARTASCPPSLPVRWKRLGARLTRCLRSTWAPTASYADCSAQRKATNSWAQCAGRSTPSFSCRAKRSPRSSRSTAPTVPLAASCENSRNATATWSANLGEKVSSVVGEFSLDNKDSALSRLVGRVESAQRQISAQFSLDNPESGLTCIVQRIERFEQAQTERTSQFETRVTTLLEKLVNRREESRRSTVHGNEFEALVGEQLQAHCVGSDEVFDSVGDTTGQIPRCKIGDFVVILGPDSAATGAAIVIEAKASGGYTLKSTLDEADQARRNRSASVCLFIHSARTAPAGLADLHRWGQDVVVVWDEDQPATDVRLKAAYMVAKALAVRAGQHDENEAASLAEMDAAIEAIRKQISGFEEIQTSATTVVNSGQRIFKRADLMSQEIERKLLILQEHTARLRSVGGEA